jgi:hypothetical protein
MVLAASPNMFAYVRLPQADPVEGHWALEPYSKEIYELVTHLLKLVRWSCALENYSTCHLPNCSIMWPGTAIREVVGLSESPSVQ